MALLGMIYRSFCSFPFVCLIFNVFIIVLFLFCDLLCVGITNKSQNKNKTIMKMLFLFDRYNCLIVRLEREAASLYRKPSFVVIILKGDQKRK